MPHLYPVVIPGGQSIRGQSLGFHAYSLRIDNLSNQWLQEQSTLAWIPPYALGTCIRMYGTAVALVLNGTPTGQPQLQPIPGEYASGFFSDEYRTEVAGVPVRQFTLVQTVSDLTEGPEPALPPVGVCRIWADNAGRVHHVHSDGTDLTLVDPSQVGVVTSAMILDGTIQGVDIGVPLRLAGTIRSTQQTEPVLPLGAPPEIGIEMFGQPSNGRSALQSVTRDGAGNSTTAPLLVYGSVTNLWGSTSLTAQSFAGDLTLNAIGGDVIPNLRTVYVSGSRQNGVPAGSLPIVISTTIGKGMWLLWAQGMAQGAGAANDNQQWTLNFPGANQVSNYMTVLAGLWNSIALVMLADNRAGGNQTVTLQITSMGQSANIAGDFSRLLGVKIA